MDESNNSIENVGEQKVVKRPWLLPYMYKKGQSGNPNGRPKNGMSMKEYSRLKLLKMKNKEREEFLEGMSKVEIWEMAEGKAKQDTNTKLEGEIKVSGIEIKLRK